MSEERELLERALEAIEYAYKGHRVSEEIRTYLSTHSDDAEEPIGYAVKMIPRGLHFIGFVGEEETEEEIEDYGPDQIVPLYTKPAELARKPMTSEEMMKQYEIDKEYFGESVMRAFYNGIRFAEKHHDIGDKDEN